MTLSSWNRLKIRVSARKKINIFQMICIGHVLEAPGLYQQTMLLETLVKNCTPRLYNHSIGLGSYLLMSNFKFNLQKYHFNEVMMISSSNNIYFYEVIMKCYLNFITCLHFPLALIRWDSSHCHLMELFKSKESYKKKFVSNNNWKT